MTFWTNKLLSTFLINKTCLKKTQKSGPRLYQPGDNKFEILTKKICQRFLASGPNCANLKLIKSTRWLPLRFRVLVTFSVASILFQDLQILPLSLLFLKLMYKINFVGRKEDRIRYDPRLRSHASRLHTIRLHG